MPVGRVNCKDFESSNFWRSWIFGPNIWIVQSKTKFEVFGLIQFDIAYRQITSFLVCWKILQFASSFCGAVDPFLESSNSLRWESKTPHSFENLLGFLSQNSICMSLSLEFSVPSSNFRRCPFQFFGSSAFGRTLHSGSECEHWCRMNLIRNICRFDCMIFNDYSGNEMWKIQYLYICVLRASLLFSFFLLGLPNKLMKLH